MIKRLIINADDYGLTEANTIATIRCHEDGILTSTTMMVNMPFARYGAELAKQHPNLGVGIHLVLTMGAPLLPTGKSFTDENGNFIRPNAGSKEKRDPINLDELYAEWEAQIKLFIEIMGKKPTHIDSHHHVHAMTPENLSVTLKLGKKYDIPVRLIKEVEDYDFEFAKLLPSFYGPNVNCEYFLEGKDNMHDHEVAEVMCHPSFLDKRLLSISSYTTPRTEEMTVIRCDKIKNWVKDNNIELINFTDLKKVK